MWASLRLPEDLFSKKSTVNGIYKNIVNVYSVMTQLMGMAFQTQTMDGRNWRSDQLLVFEEKVHRDLFWGYISLRNGNYKLRCNACFVDLNLMTLKCNKKCQVLPKSSHASSMPPSQEAAWQKKDLKVLMDKVEHALAMCPCHQES